MPEDRFKLHTPQITDPARGGQNVTFASPAVDVDLDKVSRAIRVGGEGDLVVVMEEGQELTFTMGAGDQVDVRAVTVKATSTATNIVVLW